MSTEIEARQRSVRQKPICQRSNFSNRARQHLWPSVPHEVELAKRYDDDDEPILPPRRPHYLSPHLTFQLMLLCHVETYLIRKLDRFCHATPCTARPMLSVVRCLSVRHVRVLIVSNLRLVTCIQHISKASALQFTRFQRVPDYDPLTMEN